MIRRLQMDQEKKMTEPDGLGLRESSRRMVEMWLNRDLRRLMQLSFSFADESAMAQALRKMGPDSRMKKV
jgi:hypothetical protein